MNSLNRQCVVSLLFSKVPCWSSLERHWLVVWLVLIKYGGIAVGFVLVHLLSRCHVVRAGRLLHHGGIRQGILCLCECLEALSR